MSISNCCFLTSIEISQEAGKVVWYSYLFKNFPQFIVIHTVKGFIIVNEAKVDILLEFSCFFYDPVYVGYLISGSSAFSKSSLIIWKFSVHIQLKPRLGNFEHYFASVWGKSKTTPIGDMTCAGSKVWCCKEQYCIGTWNVRYMNQGKLEVVKQEMARVNIDILGISKLKWTGMGEFNSDDHYIYCGQESIRRNGVAIIVNKRVQNAVLGRNLRNDRMISVSKAGHLISW